MGAMGTGFGQGFAQTLQTLGPIIQQRQQQREQFDLQKRESDLKLKMLDLETEKFQRDLQSGKLMEALMSGGVPTTGMSTPEFAEGAPYQTREPFNMGNPQHQQLAAQINPKLREMIFAQQLKDASAAQQRAADEQAFAGFGGGAGAPQQAPQPAGAPLPSPGVSSPMVEKRSMTLGPTGLSRTITREPKEAKGETGYIDLPGGYKQLWRTTRDPMTDAVVKQEPVGAPILQEKLQEAGETATTYGLTPGTPEFRSAMAEIVSIQSLPPDQRTPALADIRKRYAGKGGMEERAMADARTQKVLTEAATTRAKIETELATKSLEGAAATKYVALDGIQRKGIQAVELFRPEFVGKPFIDKFKGEFAAAEKLGKDYTPGYLAGQMRRFMGTASPEEVTFQNAVLELADDVLRARSGAAINESEYKRITAFLGRLSDEPTTFKASMARVIAETTAQMQSTVKLATTPASRLNPTAPTTNDAARQGGPLEILKITPKPGKR